MRIVLPKKSQHPTRSGTPAGWVSVFGEHDLVPKEPLKVARRFNAGIEAPDA